MAFRPPKKFPEFADLVGILAQSKKTENPLYQTVQEIINRLQRFRLLNIDELDDKLDEDEADARYALKTATYITFDDETATLPNSLRLLEGNGVTFDTSVENELTLNVSGGYAPMSTGAEPLEIMSDGAGSVLMVGFSE